jgi:serine/threonine protein kinase
LKGIHKAFIGEGGFKEVTKSILYGRRPKVVARCRGGRSLNREAEILRKLQGTPGIVQLKSYIHRPNRKADLILEYFNGGSLRKIQSRNHLIPGKDLLVVMQELIIGLKSLHSAGYIHRDLHRGNILFTHENGRLRAALTDFGLALKMKENLNSRISVQDRACAPEVLLLPTRYINRKKAEGYSLGSLFYYMIFGNRPAWAKVIKQFELDRQSTSQKRNMYQEIQNLYERTVAHSKRFVGIRKDLALLTFKLINPDTNKRVYLDTALKKIILIAKKWHIAKRLSHTHRCSK